MQEQSFGIGEEDGSILPEQGEGDQAGTQPIATPTIVLVALLVVTLLGVLTALYVGGSDSEEEEAEPDEMPEPDDPSRIGAVAGRAADELEDEAELENAVYRAWVDMTAELPVDRPETSTPGEFATAATEAGMDPDDVAELTSLFEAVRYGNADVTDARERRAIETLRRIEATYTEGDRS